MSDPAVLLFARLPVPGRVKTRLASTIGDAGALRFYTACAEHVFAEVDTLPARGTVFVADERHVDRVGAWVGPSFEVVAQRGAGLGDRMRHAFEHVFARGADRAVVVATDTPEVTGSVIGRALQHLDTHPVVLGPSPDGGYYLLGMRQVHAWLFDDMSWSTPDVLPTTRARIAARGLDHYELPALADVDTEADLRAWLGRDPDSDLARRVVAELELGGG